MATKHMFGFIKYISTKFQDFFSYIFSIAFGVFIEYAIINSSLGRVPKLSKINHLGGMFL